MRIKQRNPNLSLAQNSQEVRCMLVDFRIRGWESLDSTIQGLVKFQNGVKRTE